MGTLFPLLPLSLIFSVIFGSQGSSGDTIDTCRVQCLTEHNQHHHEHKHRYEKYAQLMNKIRHIHAEHEITGTAILYDNSIFVNKHHHHSSSDSSSSSSSSSEEYWENDTLDEVRKLEKFQRLLAVLAIAAKPTGVDVNNPLYYSQFDDYNAWGCSDWRCTGGCDAITGILSNMNPFTVSKDKGRIDEACYMGSLSQNDYTNYCGNDMENRLAIAIVNGPLGIEDKHDARCCHEYKHRLGVGFHRASKKELKKWSTYEVDATYLDSNDHDDVYALESLVGCIVDCACWFNVETLFPTDTFFGLRNGTIIRQTGGSNDCQITRRGYSYDVFVTS